VTTIHQSARDIAVASCRAMLDRISEPTLPARTILLSPRLVVRESRGAYLPRKTK
jgi:LacI family transcriptional regulator